MVNFDTLAEIAYKTAIEKGWYANSEKVRPIGEVVALFHSEVAEATEELRKSDVDGTKIYYIDPNASPIIVYDQNRRNDPLGACTPPKLKPEGVAVELADLLIRLGDYCGSKGIERLVQNYLVTSVFAKDEMTYPLDMMAKLHGTIHGFYLTSLRPTYEVGGSEDGAVAFKAAQLYAQTFGVCVHFGWDLDHAIELKLAYNKTRPWRHNGKLA